MNKQRNHVKEAESKLLTEPPTLETGPTLETKPSRGQHPNSRRKKWEGENELVKITINVFKRQAGITGKQIREMIDLFNIQD